jgi:threonine/homoserine/homoserine lactone efflux protein
MESHSGLAVFIGCICGLIFVIGTTLLGMLIIGDSHMLKYVFLSSAIGAVLYIVYTFFSVQFNDFLEERQELFEIIKDR